MNVRRAAAILAPAAGVLGAGAHAAPVVQARCTGTANQVWVQIQVGAISR
jgi:hypothetical protein